MSTAVLRESQTASRPSDASVNERAGMYLTFELAGEEYGVEILKVRELIGVMPITAVPCMPACMKGVINLRGKVIPVIDLRLKFGFPEIEYTEQTCIFVVDVGRLIGIIVDTVSEVLDIAGEQIAPPPAVGGAVDTSFIVGMAKVGDSVKILLDIDCVLSQIRARRMDSTAPGAEQEPGQTCAP